MDSSDWSNGIRYHILDTRPDTEFKLNVWFGIEGSHSTTQSTLYKDGISSQH